MKTASDIVEYAAAQVGRPYWYGTAGNKASKQLLSQRRKEYPKYYDQSKYTHQFEDDFGKRVHDCSGLFKAALWSAGPDATPKYNAKQDLCANDILAKACTTKGPIRTIPNVPGILVFYSGHMGIYIGGGKVIEARGHDWGVVVTDLKDRGWTDWGKSDWVSYPATTAAPEPVMHSEDESFITINTPVTLKRGYKGDTVKIAQIRVGATPDGIYGAKTAQSVEQYQRKNGLTPTGVIDRETWKKLLDNLT